MQNYVRRGMCQCAEKATPGIIFTFDESRWVSFLDGSILAIWNETNGAPSEPWGG